MAAWRADRPHHADAHGSSCGAGRACCGPVRSSGLWRRLRTAGRDAAAAAPQPRDHIRRRTSTRRGSKPGVMAVCPHWQRWPLQRYHAWQPWQSCALRLRPRRRWRRQRRWTPLRMSGVLQIPG